VRGPGRACGPRRRSFAAVTVALVAAATACTLPARSYDAFKGKAVESATMAQNATQTTLLVAHAASAGKLTAAYASVAVSNAETDANGAQSSFLAIQPPDGRSQKLRSQLGDILSDATSAIADVRIAARRGQLSRLEQIAKPLRGITARLDAFEQANR
jgi:hypothetical protein